MKYLSVNEVCELGVLQEVNRLLLHPRGLAIEVRFDPIYGGPGELRVQDHRGDPEGVYFGDLSADEAHVKADAFEGLLQSVAQGRREALGYIVQPLPREEWAHESQDVNDNQKGDTC